MEGVTRTFICKCGSHVPVGSLCSICGPKTGPPKIDPSKVKEHFLIEKDVIGTKGGVRHVIVDGKTRSVFE